MGKEEHLPAAEWARFTNNAALLMLLTLFRPPWPVIADAMTVASALLLHLLRR